MKGTFTNNFTLLFFIAALFSVLSCQKDIDGGGSTRIDTPVSGNAFLIEGLVTDETGRPLQNVVIQAGDVQVTTDINGSFRAADARFTGNESFVIAKLPGYFTGSRTFLPRLNSNNYVKIRLLQRAEASSLNATTGGTVNVGAGSLSFPANSFIVAGGAAYSGPVSVKAVYLDPANPFMNEMMPGDLRGQRASGELRGLRTFGMMKVELEGSAGQLLQIAQGSVVQMSMPVPQALMSLAPATIPLWYFDESTGLWKEEGEAQKAGNNYVGSVSHFTFWNLDDPYPYTKIDMRVLNRAQQGLQGVKVELTSVADSTSSYDYTDQNGYIDGYVPANTQLHRYIYNECDSLIFTDIIGPFTVDTDLGDVVITNVTNQQTITGSVTDCSSLPLASGYVVITVPGRTVYANVVNGNFTVTYTSCTVATSASVVAINPSANQQGSAVSVPLTSPSVVVGAIQACGASSNEYFTLTVDGISRTWTPVAPYNFYMEEDAMNNGGFHDLYFSAQDTSVGGLVELLLFRSEDSLIAPYHVGIQSMSVFDPLAATNMIGDYFLDNTQPITPMALLNEYGPVGSFISGTFSGLFIRNDGQTSATVTVSCSFRMRRD